MQTCQQGIVAFEFLAKTKAGIEHDAAPLDTMVNRSFRPISEISFHFSNNIRRWCKSAPLFRPSASVHEDKTAFELGYSRGHLRVPMKGAHVVHNLRSRIYGSASDLRLISVHGQDSVGAFQQNVLNHGHDAVQLFLYRHTRFADFGAWACGFAANIENIGAVFKHLQRVADGVIAREKFAAIEK